MIPASRRTGATIEFRGYRWEYCAEAINWMQAESTGQELHENRQLKWETNVSGHLASSQE